MDRAAYYIKYIFTKAPWVMFVLIFLLGWHLTKTLDGGSKIVGIIMLVVSGICLIYQGMKFIRK